jgi:hypothetical protein
MLTACTWYAHSSDVVKGEEAMNKTVELNRKGQTIKVVIRQMAHDEQAIVGKKYRYGSGSMWTVVSVA